MSMTMMKIFPMMILMTKMISMRMTTMIIGMKNQRVTNRFA